MFCSNSGLTQLSASEKPDVNVFQQVKNKIQSTHRDISASYGFSMSQIVEPNSEEFKEVT